uniref:Sushi domain-containing protein n=1 Tax=Taeniopygia guttata TaxID=59729 RepID=A0A674G998_TAEGU
MRSGEFPITIRGCLISLFRPKAVANARIEVGNRTELNSRLRYSCNPGYKRKAGTSNLIQCILWNGSEPRWTDPTLQCIPSSQSPVPPAPDGLSPDGSRPPEMIPTPDTPTLGEGTTPLPIPPTDYAPGWAESQGNTNLPWGLFLLLFQWNSSFSPTSFSVRFLPASIPFLPLQLKISFLSFFPVSIQSVASSVGKLGKKKPKRLIWEKGAYVNFFKFQIPFGGCGSFIPWAMGMPLSGGRIYHPNFLLERIIPNSLPLGVGRAPRDGAQSGFGSLWSYLDGIHQLWVGRCSSP